MGTTTQIDPEVTVALQGTLDTFALPDVLRLLAATKKTGRLRITGSRGTGSLWVGDGAVSTIEANHAPHAIEPEAALFELLRFEDGSFSFDAEATHDAPGEAQDVEALLEGAEALLGEWREIERVVPSLDAWVTLRRSLAAPEVSIDQARWTTLVTVGGGATVRRMGEDLCLSELPISRAVRDLAELGLVDIAPAAPPGQAGAAAAAGHDAAATAVTEDVAAPAEPVAPVADPDEGALPALDVPITAELDAPLPAARPLRARRAKGVRDDGADAATEPERFVPLDLPGGAPGSYDPPEELEEGDVDMDDLAAAFPGLASRTADPTPEEAELARQLAMLSSRAADAVRAAAEATTIEERDAALDQAEEGEDAPINRGLLLKFLSSVKS